MENTEKIGRVVARPSGGLGDWISGWLNGRR